MKTRLEEWNLPFSTISSCILLLIIYTTFCDTFTSKYIECGKCVCVSGCVIMVYVCLRKVEPEIVVHVVVELVRLVPITSISDLMVCSS